MKNLFFSVFVLLAFSTQIDAQSQDYVAGNDGWQVELEKAYNLSQKTGKPILANFTGSDWCGWCKRLTSSVFVHDEFKEWADDNVILLELDFPRRKQVPQEIKTQNASLQQAFGITGYPTIWVFDLEKENGGKFNISALGKTGYSRTVGEFTGAVDQMIAKRGK